jgi:hypothetical protein
MGYVGVGLGNSEIDDVSRLIAKGIRSIELYKLIYGPVSNRSWLKSKNQA